MSVFAIALALGAPTPAAQDFTPAQKDGRCVVALQKVIDGMGESEDKEGLSAVTGVMLFYLGRLSTRVAPAQMEAAIDAAEDTLDGAELEPLTMGCIEKMGELSGASRAG